MASNVPAGQAPVAGESKKPYPTREEILARYRERLNQAPGDFSVTRRRFLAVAAAGWAVFALAMTGASLAVFRSLIPNVDFTKILKVKVGTPDRFAPETVDESFKDKKIWIIRDCEKIVALRTVCTHLGCTPNWMPDENKFKCPCHGSGFRGPKGCYGLAGMNFEGPAPRPLERFKITRGEDGQLLVDESVIYRWELGEWSNPESYYAV